jgi:hypothetical protein
LKCERQDMDMIAAYREVGSYRGAAEMCGSGHKTVKRAVLRHLLGAPTPGERPERVRNYDGVADVVAARVKSTHGRISAKRLLPEARTAGYEGSARNFRRLVVKAKRAWQADHHRGRRPAVWAPGNTLVIDWGSEGGLHVSLRRGRLELLALRGLRHRREGRDDVAVASRVPGGAGRGAQGSPLAKYVPPRSSEEAAERKEWEATISVLARLIPPVSAWRALPVAPREGDDAHLGAAPPQLRYQLMG